MWRVFTFSGLRIAHDESGVAAIPAQRGALLAILAAAGERGLPRGRLLVLLWPESTEQRARHNLSQAIYATNRQLGQEVIASTGADVHLQQDVATDVATFLAACGAGDDRRVADCYSGLFLDGFILPNAPEFEEWLAGERRRFERMARASLERLAVTAALPEAVEHWQRLAAMDPLASRYAIGGARAIARSGDPGAALHLLREHAQVLERETGAATPEDVSRLMQELAAPPVRTGTPATRDENAPSVSAPANATPRLVLETPTFHRGEQPSGRPGTRVARAWPRWALAATVGGVLIAAGVWRDGRATFPVATGSMVVLADVQDLTPGATMGPALGVAASVALQQSAHFDVRTRAGLAGALQRMQRSAGDPFPEAVAVELAQRDGARAVVALSIAALGPQYLLAAHLVNPVTGKRAAATQRTVTTNEELLLGVGALMVWARRELGDTEWRTATPLPQVTATSLEALRAFGDAQTAVVSGAYDRVRPAVDRALAADTGFAAVRMLMGSFLIFNNNVPDGLAALREAARRAQRMTPRERLELQRAMASAEGRQQDAVEAAGTLAAQFPSRETWWGYGESLRIAGLASQAIPALQRALELDSTLGHAHHSMAQALRELGDTRGAIRAYARTWQYDSASLLRDFYNQQWGATYVEAREYAAAESVFRRMLSRPDVNSRARGFRALAYLALYRGRYREAAGHLEQGLSLYQGPSLSAYRDLLLLADARLTQGAHGPANLALDRALDMFRQRNLEAGFLALAVHQLSRAGRLGDAQLVLDTLARRAALRPQHVDDQGALRVARADLDLARGRAESALRQLGDVELGALQPIGEHLRVQALASLRRLDSATAARALSANPPFGVEGQQDAFRALVTLGDHALARGDTAMAREAWSQLATRWADGDSDLEMLVNARRSLRALEGPQSLVPRDAARRRTAAR